MGVAVNAAMSDKPKEALGKILNPPAIITVDDLPAVSMLRPVYKDKKKEPE